MCIKGARSGDPGGVRMGHGGDGGRDGLRSQLGERGGSILSTQDAREPSHLASGTSHIRKYRSTSTLPMPSTFTMKGRLFTPPSI